MRLDGESVLAQAETPEWQVPVLDGEQPAEELATPATDAYKFGLLVVRIFAGDQQVRDPAAAGSRLRGELRRLAGRSLSTDPDERPLPERWIGVLDAAIARAPASVPAPAAPDPPVRVAAPQSPAPATVRLPRARRQLAATRGWLGFVPVLAVLIGVIAGVVNGSDGTSDALVGGRPLTFPTYDALPTYPIFPTYAAPRLPTDLTTGLPTYPWLATPPPLISVLCVRTEVEIGPGLNPKNARVRQATEPVQDFACSLSRDDQDTGFSGRGGSAPDATQRGRFAKLADGGPYDKATIIGLRTGPNGAPQVNVVFQPFAADVGADCWRSRLSLAKTDDGYRVSALTAPTAVGCG
jgi:hypothetical protein